VRRWRGMSDKPMLKGGQKQIKAPKADSTCETNEQNRQAGESRSRSLRGSIDQPTGNGKMRNRERVLERGLEQAAEEAGKTAKERKKRISLSTYNGRHNVCLFWQGYHASRNQRFLSVSQGSGPPRVAVSIAQSLSVTNNAVTLIGNVLRYQFLRRDRPPPPAKVVDVV
jgi:hypothetical protein